MSKDQQQRPAARKGPQARASRLERELRANIGKRKEQAKARARAATSPDAETDGSSAPPDEGT
jgi:hypothetical protein